jgi:hypothetical protein
VAVQTDGKVLLGGYFTTLQPNGAASATTRNRIARINADGTLDTGFNPNPNDFVHSVVVQADGKVLLGGRFTALQPNGMASATTQIGFARLLNDPAAQILAAASAAQVTWTRSGSATEISQVAFDMSTNGGVSYTALPGTAIRVGTTPNWQLSGLSLPASGLLRARGRTSGGFCNGSSGLIEQVASYSIPFPEISVTESTVSLSNGDSFSFGNTVMDTPVTKTFTITNSGNATLADLVVTVSGDEAEFFVVGPLSATSIPAGGGDATFEVSFVPDEFGSMAATLHIASNDLDENPFDISLTGTAFSTTLDSDGDGLNDWAEFQMAALGFDWEVSQPALVATLNNGANDAGFYTAAQVQALHVGTPLLQRDPVNGEFTLTIGMKKSVDLVDFNPFQITAPQITINGSGELEIRFVSPDDAAFFRLGVD